jgi:hypothetical protein
MPPTAILYPSIAMFALTLGTMVALGVARYGAIHRGDVSISFFRTYDQGSQPARLHLLARHVQNHFEVPPLFHVGVLLTFASGSVGPVSVVFAWLFVAARCVHSYIHLGSNNVSRRFFTFGTSLLFLAGLWLTLLCSLVTATP